MNWLHTPFAAALARALVHFLWQGALIAALLWVMLAALRRASAQARYLAACAAMSAMAASFAFTVIDARSAEPRLISRVAVPLSWLTPDIQAGQAAAAPLPPAGWAVALWLLGVAVLLLRRAGGWLAARRMLSRAAVAADDRWVARLDELRRAMGIPRAVALVESALAAAPSVIGWLSPVILAPAGWLMGLPASQAEAVLMHELAHVRRRDYLVNLLQSVVEDVLFYHPAVWWTGRVMRRERENCCDDMVLAMGGDRRAYAYTLASLEGVRAGEPALAASGGWLADRIRRLARPPAGPRASAAPLVLAMAMVCAASAALPAWQAPPLAPAPAPAAAEVPAPAPVAEPEPGPAPQATQHDPYQKWLNEDVVYIIQDEERAAFQRLTTEEEKEHFIEQFWARRGVAFKEEHYRRIAYANEKFADGRLPGWKTDRGRVYISYGPPDEKEVHPNGEAGGPPYEEWMYRKFLGGADHVVRFEDRGHDGRFVQVVHQGFVRDALPPPVNLRVATAAAISLPAVQSNGVYLYESGGLSVRVGVHGATMISLDAEEGRLTLNRITRHDGGGELVFQESTSTKLLTLEPGIYRVQAEMAGGSADVAARMKDLQSRTERLNAQMAAMRQTYRPDHPSVLALDAQIANLRTLLTFAQEQRKHSGAAVLQFRVP